MGFQFESRTARVVFDESTDYPGAEAVVDLNIPMDVMFKFMEFSSENASATEQRAVFREFGDLALVEWNLMYKDGSPIPANGEGLLLQPGGFAFAGELLRQWADAASGNDAPLETASTSGSPSVVSLSQASGS